MSFLESTGARLSRLLEYPNFVRFLSARLLASIAVQMQTVAVGWQIYAITGIRSTSAIFIARRSLIVTAWL